MNSFFYASKCWDIFLKSVKSLRNKHNETLWLIENCINASILSTSEVLMTQMTDYPMLCLPNANRSDCRDRHHKRKHGKENRWTSMQTNEPGSVLTGACSSEGEGGSLRSQIMLFSDFNPVESTSVLSMAPSGFFGTFPLVRPRHTVFITEYLTVLSPTNQIL